MLSDHIKRTTREIDAFLERYTLGTLIVDGDTVLLEAKNCEIVLDETYVIEVFDGEKYHSITYDQARNTMSRDGWPLYAGLEARVKKGEEVKPNDTAKRIRLQNATGSYRFLHKKSRGSFKKSRPRHAQ